MPGFSDWFPVIVLMMRIKRGSQVKYGAMIHCLVVRQNIFGIVCACSGCFAELYSCGWD